MEIGALSPEMTKSEDATSRGPAGKVRLPEEVTLTWSWGLGHPLSSHPALGSHPGSAPFSGLQYYRADH